jgi:hypothetical protein
MKFFAVFLTGFLFLSIGAAPLPAGSNQFPGIVTDETFAERAFSHSGGFLEKDDLITSMLFLEYLYLDLSDEEIDRIFKEIGGLYRKIKTSAPENDLESTLIEIYVNLIDFAPESMDKQEKVTYVSEVFTTGDKDCDSGLFLYYAFLEKLGLGDEIRFRFGKSHLTMELPDNRIFESNLNLYLETEGTWHLVKDPVIIKNNKNRFFFDDLYAYVAYANLEEPDFELIHPGRYLAERYQTVAHNTAVNALADHDYDEAAIAIEAVRLLKK